MGSDLLILCGRPPALGDLTNEAITPTMGSFNKAWRLGIITKRLTDLTNHDFQDGFANKGFWPNGVEKFLFGDQLAWSFKQMTEHSELLRPKLDRLRTPPQTLVRQVQAKEIKADALLAPHSLLELYRSFTPAL